MPRRPGQTAPRTKSVGLRARAWWVIRKNKVTTMAGLLLTLADGSQKDAKSNLTHYLRALSRSGVLSRERIPDGKLTSNGVYRYRLEKDFGAKPPVVRQDGVYDPNSGALHPFGTEDTEPAMNDAMDVLKKNAPSWARGRLPKRWTTPRPPSAPFAPATIPATPARY
ncbi:hypothetical protein [Methylogaea oryzae]|uniref:hypothetical protein n=1 Tax=Methylogaea oryzae TaxID=1295382 RepID=UPI0006CF9853|nr:hypothetical protein [Methylogaea oryzae]